MQLVAVPGADVRSDVLDRRQCDLWPNQPLHCIEQPRVKGECVELGHKTLVDVEPLRHLRQLVLGELCCQDSQSRVERETRPQVTNAAKRRVGGDGEGEEMGGREGGGRLFLAREDTVHMQWGVHTKVLAAEDWR